MTFCRSSIWNGTLRTTCLGLAAASPVWADEALFANVYHATVTPIESSRSCSGPGMLPFQATFVADKLEIALSGTGYDKKVIFLSNGEIYPTERSCYMTVRRGSNVQRTEVPCLDTPPPARLPDGIGEGPFAAKLTANAEICLTVTSLTMTPGEWELELTSGDDTASVSGDFLAEDHVLHFQLSNSLAFDQHSFLKPPRGLSAELSLLCIDTGLEFDDGETAKASLHAEFKIAEKGSEECGLQDKACYRRVSDEERQASSTWRVRENLLTLNCNIPSDEHQEEDQ